MNHSSLSSSDTLSTNLLLVLVLAPGGFSLGTAVFPSPQKPAFPNSNSIFAEGHW